MAKSKYAAVLPGLPRLGPETTYQQRVDILKAEMINTNPLKLVEQYIAVRRELDTLDATFKWLNLQLEALTQLLVASQDQGDDCWGQYGVGDNAVRLPSGDTVRVKSEPYGRVADKEAFRQWCIANGYERQLQLWPQTMNAITKERLLDGQNPPEGVEVYRKDSLVFVRAGKEAD